MTTRKVGLDLNSHNKNSVSIKLFKGDSIDLNFNVQSNIANYKIRAELHDNAGCFKKIATANSGGADSQIQITDGASGLFSLHIDKNETTNFNKQAVLEIEFEDSTGDILESRKINVEFRTQQITWTTP